MAEFDLEVECPHCGALLTFPRVRAGHSERCPVCRGSVTIAAASGSEEAAGPFDRYDEDAFEAPPLEVTDDAGNCLVCCRTEQKLNVMALSPIVQNFTGLVRRDAATQVTHGMGILAEGLAPDTAHNMADACAEEGVEAAVVPMSMVPDLSHEVRIERIYDLDDEALHVQMDSKGTVRALSWTALVAGIVTKPKYGGRREVRYVANPAAGFAGPYGATRSAAAYRMRTRKVELPTRATFVLQDPQGRLHRMVVEEARVRYAYLGDRVLGSGDMNFTRFLADVERHAVRAFFPRSYRQVAAGGLMHVQRTTGTVDYENYLRWAVACAAAEGLLRSG